MKCFNFTNTECDKDQDTICPCKMRTYFEKGQAYMLDEVIKKLAESEDTMLSDKQYYTLMELKEQKK